MKRLLLPIFLMAVTPTSAFATLIAYDSPKSLPSGYLGECPASDFEFLIGKESSSLRWLSTDTDWVRFILPGRGYTMEYIPDRLNIHMDQKGKVERLSCG